MTPTEPADGPDSMSGAKERSTGPADGRLARKALVSVNRRPTVLALDVEATLISSAVSQFPRPHLYGFLEECRGLFDRVVVFTTVNEVRFRQIARTLTQEGSVPPWFSTVAFVSWTGATKDLSFIPDCAIDDALLVDDMAAYVHPGQERRWVRVEPFEPPFDPSDDGLTNVLKELKDRVRPGAPS